MSERKGGGHRRVRVYHGLAVRSPGVASQVQADFAARMAAMHRRAFDVEHDEVFGLQMPFANPARGGQDSMIAEAARNVALGGADEAAMPEQAPHLNHLGSQLGFGFHGYIVPVNGSR